MPQADELSITFAPFWGIFKGLGAISPQTRDAGGGSVLPRLRKTCSYDGSRRVGKRMTSRIVSRPVRSIASRSMPNPSPPVGGMP
jgi:hypothetical protein